MDVFDSKLQRQKENPTHVQLDDDSVFVCIHEEHCLVVTNFGVWSSNT